MGTRARGMGGENERRMRHRYRHVRSTARHDTYGGIGRSHLLENFIVAMRTSPVHFHRAYGHEEDCY